MLLISSCAQSQHGSRCGAGDWRSSQHDRLVARPRISVQGPSAIWHLWTLGSRPRLPGEPRTATFLLPQDALPMDADPRPDGAWTVQSIVTLTRTALTNSRAIAFNVGSPKTFTALSREL